MAKAVAASVEEGMKRQKQAKRAREKLERDYVPPPKRERTKSAPPAKPSKKTKEHPQSSRYTPLTLPPDVCLTAK